MKLAAVLAGIVSVLCFAAPLQAGFIYKMQSSGSKKSKAPDNVSEMKIEGLKLRMDQTEGKAQTTMIFDGDTDQMYVVDHKKKNYFVFDEEMIEGIAAQMSEAMKQMEEALANVPAGQREMVEKMMKQRLGSIGGSQTRGEPEVNDLGRTETVAEISCEWKEISRGGQTGMRGCFADWKDLPGGEDLLAVSNDMRDFISSLIDALSSASGFSNVIGSIIQTPMNDMAIADGFPLVSETFKRGKVAHTARFLEASEAVFSEDDFRPPAGYKRQDIVPEAGGKGR